MVNCLTSETVQGTALPLEGIHHIHSGDGLPLGMLSVGDGITDNVLKENLQNTSGLLVDEAGDTLDTSTASQTTNGRLGDALDIVTKNLAMTLSATFAESLSTLAASSHIEERCCQYSSTIPNEVCSPLYT